MKTQHPAPTCTSVPAEGLSRAIWEAALATNDGKTLKEVVRHLSSQEPAPPATEADH